LIAYIYNLLLYNFRRNWCCHAWKKTCEFYNLQVFIYFHSMYWLFRFYD